MRYQTVCEHSCFCRSICLIFFSTSPLHTITAVHNIAARMPGVVASWVSEVDVPATVEASVAAKVVVSEIVYAPKRARKEHRRAISTRARTMMLSSWLTNGQPEGSPGSRTPRTCRMRASSVRSSTTPRSTRRAPARRHQKNSCEL